MEAVSTSEKSVIVCQTARLNIPEFSRLHTRHCEHLKYLGSMYLVMDFLSFNFCRIYFLCLCDIKLMSAYTILLQD